MGGRYQGLLLTASMENSPLLCVYHHLYEMDFTVEPGHGDHKVDVIVIDP